MYKAKLINYITGEIFEDECVGTLYHIGIHFYREAIKEDKPCNVALYLRGTFYKRWER